MRMYRLTSPTKFTGKIGPVTFVDGVTETDHPSVVAYCRRQGYTVEEVKPQRRAKRSDDGAGGDS